MKTNTFNYEFKKVPGSILFNDLRKELYNKKKTN